MTPILRPVPAALALALFGCEQISQPPATVSDGLTAAHVGGHLGSYRDCPDEAWENHNADDAAPDRVAGAPDADCDGACGPLNCEAARLTFTLSNQSDVDAEGVEPVALFLLDRDGLEIVELPIAATLDEDGQPFDGALDAGGQALLHIEFVGLLDAAALVGPPADGDGAFDWRSGVQLRLLIGAATHDDTGLDTPLVYSLPEIDT